VEQGRVIEIKKKAKQDGVMKVPTFIGHLMQDYCVVDGAWLDERNFKWVQNDYVKFIRFAQCRIDKTGEGIVGYITSNSYLDGLIFRGMRHSLMRSFNEIYIFDLHGNSNKNETSLDGGHDENVFNITEGVALVLCVKERNNSNVARVLHAGMLGSKEAKYGLLLETDLSKTEWKELKPVSPNYFFVPQAVRRRSEYEKFWRITEIMPENLLGFQTHRDPVAIAFDEASLKNQVTKFLGKETILPDL
jgi:predicted helicase